MINKVEGMSVDARRQVIASYGLKNMPRPSARLIRPADETDSNKDGAQASIIERNAMAFTPGTSSSVINDVNNCLLFATRVASDAFDVETQNTQWFKLYNQVLTDLCWFPATLTYYKDENNDVLVKMDKLVLDLLAKALAAAAVPQVTVMSMLELAGQMVESFRSDEEKLTLFERRTRGREGANFSLGTCSEAADGTTHIVISTVNFQSKKSENRVLFVEWSSGQANVYGGGRNWRFNRKAYADVRDTVESELGIDGRSRILSYRLKK